jgi:hypothetical protein
MKFNPMERVTLAALLGGLQNGVSGDQAMPLLQSILAQRQGRIADRRAMAQGMQQTLLGLAGSANGPEASQAYLQSLIDSNYIKPRMGERLTDFNTALYPSGGQSPLYGITGEPSQAAPTSIDQQVYSEVATAMAPTPANPDGNLDATPAEVYQSIVMSGSPIGYWAMQNPQEAMQYIAASIATINPPDPEDSKPKFNPYGPSSEWATSGGPVSNGPSFTNRQGQVGANPYISGYTNSGTSGYIR